MSTLQPAQTLFKEIDRIEDENAFNVAVLLKTIDSEQKRSNLENQSLNNKVKDLHDSVTSRHSIIVQLQAKLKRAEAQNRLDICKHKSQVDKLNCKVKNLVDESEAEKDSLNNRIKRLTSDLEVNNKDHVKTLDDRNSTEKDLRSRIQELLQTISIKDDNINELSAKVSTAHSASKAHKARTDRIVDDLTDRLVVLCKAKDEELINIRTKHHIELDSTKQVILIRDDHVKHLTDKLEKSDERLAGKVNLIKAEYDSKVFELQNLNKENDRELFRLKSQIEDKSKNCYEKDMDLGIKSNHIKSLDAQINSLKENIKEIENKANNNQATLKLEFSSERKAYQTKIETAEKNKLKSINELSKLDNLNDTFGHNLDNNFKKMCEIQEKSNMATLEYHDSVKTNFNKLVRTTHDAMGYMIS